MEHFSAALSKLIDDSDLSFADIIAALEITKQELILAVIEDDAEEADA